MRRMFLAATMVFMLLALMGCGDGDSNFVVVPPPPEFVSDILSSETFDGYIAHDPVAGTFTVTQGLTPTVQSLFAGIDPATGIEYRAFLDFPLGGPAGVPANAVIVSAFLDIVITSIRPPNGTIPIRIELVNFQPPTLLQSDFDRASLPPIAFTIIDNPPINQADVGTHVTVDVTPLMVEAQRQRLANFQLRILEDLRVVPPGLIEINDTTGPNRFDLAPFLQVTYF